MYTLTPQQIVRRLPALLVVFLAGCGGPTHTAGTSGMAAKDLAVLSVPQLPAEYHVRIQTIQFDDAGDEYDIGKGRDFYLLPREHTASFTVSAVVPGVGGMFVPNDALTLPGPKHIPLGTLSAGKSYELWTPAQGFDRMLESGDFGLVREKGK